MELNSGSGVCFLEVSCVGNKWCVNIMSVCSARSLDFRVREYYIIDCLVNGYACIIFLGFVY